MPACRCSILRPRQVVLTRDRFYVGRPASLDFNDTIPLHEIEQVVEMDDEFEIAHIHHSLF